MLVVEDRLTSWQRETFRHGQPEQTITEVHVNLVKSEWAVYMLSRPRVGICQGNDLIRNSSGNARPHSSQLARPLWTDPGLKSSTGARTDLK